MPGSHWLDDELTAKIRVEKDGVVYPARGTLSIGAGLSVTDDPTNDRILIESDAGPSSSTTATIILTESGDGDLTFNGDGSGGAKILGPVSIIQLDGIFDDLVYTLSKDSDTGIREGWIVFVAIIGYKTPLTNTGSLAIKEGEADADPIVFDVSNNHQVGIWYFDGVDWYRIIATFSGSPP